jgi:UDP-N-acetylglucosamine--N-acetylmuramyl-(pentapeptide) pyrophosphoryl-undecaprenol N-acetylglucosamine transferase
MPEILKATTLLISRAGASTLAEITALGLPSILIPSPYVTNNHQEKNARWLEEKEAPIVVTEAELTGELLKEKINELLEEHEHYSENAKQLGITDAAMRIYTEIKQLLEK